MKTRLFKYLERVRTSLWFLPALMTIGSAAFAYGMVIVDRQVGHKLPEGMNWAYSGGAEGASAVLGTIAGSMVTLAGVVFSLTLVALSLASSQFGPRLLRNFMRDRTNQITIGTFVATFMYCLLVLRTVRRIEDATFVPELSVTVGVGFALASLGVLIYFIHHVATSIQADEVVARVSEELCQSIERLLPEQPDDAASNAECHDLPADFAAGAVAIAACGDGYLELVDFDGLMKLAQQEDLILRIERRAGQYVTEESTVAFAYPQARVTGTLSEAMRAAFVLGSRTAAQDIEFSLNQLVEIAVRALSPGINDPFTAVACVDRLGTALSRLARRRMPSPHRHDEHGRLRIVAPVSAFPELLAAGFNQVRQHGASSVAVTIRLLETIAQIGAVARRHADIAALQQQADMAVSASRRLPIEGGDRRDIEEHYSQVRVTLARRSKSLGAAGEAAR